MTVYKTAYDTTTGKLINMSVVDKYLRQAIIKDRVSEMNMGLISSDEAKPVFITGKYGSEKEIPMFDHPYLVMDVGGTNYICVDIRPLIKKADMLDANGTNVDTVIRNKMEWDFIYSRMVYQLSWLDDVNNIKNIGDYPVKVYSTLLSGLLASRINLDPAERLRVGVVAINYYYSLFNNGGRNDLGSIMYKTTKLLPVNKDFVSDVYSSINPAPESLSDFVNNIKGAIVNRNIDSLNEGVLVGLMGNLWYGTGSTTMGGVMLEHPPTWVSVLESVLGNRGYKNSTLGRIAYNNTKGKMDEIMLKALKNIKDKYNRIVMEAYLDELFIGGNETC